MPLPTAAVGRPAFSRSDLRDELAGIERHMTRIWGELRALQPDRMRRERIETAGAELGAIVSETEEAANRIITAAEGLMAARFDTVEDYRVFNDAQAVAILEACSFQDITGQRVSKVSALLAQVSERIARMASALGVVDAETPEEELAQAEADRLIAGPVLPDERYGHGVGVYDRSVNQSELDELFE
jgi:chemotaxis protein CheZ